MSGHLIGRIHLGNLGVDGGTILMCILIVGCQDVDWIHLAWGRVQWQAFMNKVMNIWTP